MTSYGKKLAELQDETALLDHAEQVITAALTVKRKVVEEDPFDHGSRLMLNFGHTIGHGLEKQQRLKSAMVQE